MATASTSKTSRSTRRISTIVIDSENEEGYELDENGERLDIKPSSRASATRGKGRVKKEKVVYVIDDSDDEPQAGPSQPSKARRGKREMTPVKEEVVQEDDEGTVDTEVKQEAEVEAGPEEKPVKEPTPARAVPHGSAQEPSEEEEEDAEATAAVLEEATESTPAPSEDEEQSLLDPPLSSVPLREQPQAAPAPAEPEGPKARLVIHKMALINFKSYAGRQEIGPFHKVRSSIRSLASQLSDGYV